MSVRTRFAPSPTGFLHLGNIRSALFPWAFARHHRGTFILRIEDTDQERSTLEAEQAIVDAMAWLGLDYDEGPYYQMQRMDRYRAVLDDMLARGLAYRCYTTPAELDALRAEQMARGEKPRYDGRWRPENARRHDAARGRRAGRAGSAIRDDGAVAWHDAVKGAIEIGNTELDDLVIARADGTPTYNFCVVVDDLDMRITHVIRGDDHVNNTPRQINIMRALGASPRLCASADGADARMARSSPSVTARAASCNIAMTATCARRWSTTSRGSAGRMVTRKCSASTNSSAGSISMACRRRRARFDPEKLKWLNHEHMKRLDPDEIGAPAGAIPRGAPASSTASGPVACRGSRRFFATVRLRSSTWRRPRAISIRHPRWIVRCSASRSTPPIAGRSSNCTLEFAALDWTRDAIGPAIKAAAARHGVKPAAGDDAAARARCRDARRRPRSTRCSSWSAATRRARGWRRGCKRSVNLRAVAQTAGRPQYACLDYRGTQCAHGASPRGHFPMAASSPADTVASPLPKGTVTFLFTDIEGSTRLWETQHAAMQAALPRHDALVRHCIAAHGGHVFKTGGDAFCAAFHTASDALAAALEAQRALHREPWPDPVKIRVRMALHTGAVELRDGDYFGPPLNRVARLLSAGHGGQTLLSESTHDLVSRSSAAAGHRQGAGRARAQGPRAPRSGVPALPSRSAAGFSAVEDRDGAARQGDAVDRGAAVRQHEPRRGRTSISPTGSSEELLNVLAKIRGLRVASRTSAFSFKGKDVDIPTVAQKLNVATVLEGSVRKSGKRVRITAQLIQVADRLAPVVGDLRPRARRHLRGAGRHRAVGGEGAACGTAGRGPRRDRGAPKRRPKCRRRRPGRADNPEALPALSAGALLPRAHDARRTSRAASAYFEQAIALDPEIRARRGRACRAATGRRRVTDGAPVNRGSEQAREAAQRALALAPDLAEAHAALGLVLESHDWDWRAPIANCSARWRSRPAMRTCSAPWRASPASLGATTNASSCCARRSRSIRSVSPAGASSGLRCAMTGRLDEAEAALRRALDLNPKAGLVHCFLGDNRLWQGHAAEALELAEHEVLPTSGWWERPWPITRSNTPRHRMPP